MLFRYRSGDRGSAASTPRDGGTPGSAVGRGHYAGTCRVKSNGLIFGFFALNIFTYLLCTARQSEKFPKISPQSILFYVSVSATGKRIITLGSIRKFWLFWFAAFLLMSFGYNCQAQVQVPNPGPKSKSQIQNPKSRGLSYKPPTTTTHP